MYKFFVPRGSENKPRKLSWKEFRDPRVLRLWYPNWHRVHAVFNRPLFAADTANKTLRISYRRLNEWDARGYLGSSRKSRRGWRRFRALDLFSLGVLSELRGAGLPVVLFKKDRRFAKSFAGHLWDAMSYLVDGKEAFLETDLSGALPPLGTAVITVGLRGTARRLFSRLEFPDLRIEIGPDLKYRFESPRAGPLDLEPLPLTPHTWRMDR